MTGREQSLLMAIASGVSFLLHTQRHMLISDEELKLRDENIEVLDVAAKRLYEQMKEEHAK